MTNDPNTPTEPDLKLRANPHYWLYKITRDALDNKNHHLHDMGHIWNRWSCEGLSDAEAKELGIDLDRYPPLSDAEKEVIRDYIRNTEHQTYWDFPNLDKEISFAHAEWDKDINFSFFIFRASVDFTNSIFIKNATFFGATFAQNANFCDARFTSNADFSAAKFIQDAYFRHATFIKNSTFSARFTQNSDFFNATFTGNVYFSNAHFSGNIIKFYNCRFHQLTHSDTESDIKFSFQNVVFDTTVNFAKAEFKYLPNMTGVDFRGGINLDGVKFPQDFDGNHEEQITGGLDAKNAERTWRAFSSEMEKSGNHEQAVKYFGYALDARSSDAKGFFKLIFKDNAGAEDWFKWILKIYKSISDYGQSISKPVWLWVKLIGIFWLFYYISLYFNNGYCNWIWDRRCDMDIRNFLISLKLAIKGAVPIVSDQTTFFDRMFIGDTSVINANNVLELGIFPLLYGVQTILSLILIFLFGLGVRHRLRLK